VSVNALDEKEEGVDSIRSGRNTQRRLAATGAVLALALTALGGTSSAGVARSGARAATPSWAPLFAKYVGVKKVGAANSKLPPITVGWVNAQGGIVQSPESTQAMDAAVKVINTYLGGVAGGHPLKVRKCFVVQQESQGQACAQQMLNDPKVKLIMEGILPFGAVGFHQTNKGKKPVIGYDPISTSSATGKNTYEITAGLFGTDPGEVAYAAGILHAKTVSLLYPEDDPAGVTAAKLFQQIAAGANLKVTAVGFSSTATDLLAPMTAAGVQSTDVSVVFLVNPTVCQAGSKAIDQLHPKRVIALALCLDPAVAKGLGDYPKWTYVSTNESANLPQADKYVAAWLKAISALVPQNPAVFAPFPQLAFGTTLTVVQQINRIGYAKFSSASFAARMKTYTGPSMFGPPNLKFGSVPGLPALGSTAVRLYTYLGNNKWADATGGKWVGGR
jgi:branched-chain amino acid transport system substrate-binding protein